MVGKKLQRGKYVHVLRFEYLFLLQGKLHSLYNVTVDGPGGSMQRFGVCIRSFLPYDLREAVVRIVTKPMMGANTALFILQYTDHPDEVILYSYYYYTRILCSYERACNNLRYFLV